MFSYYRMCSLTIECVLYDRCCVTHFVSPSYGSRAVGVYVCVSVCVCVCLCLSVFACQGPRLFPLTPLPTFFPFFHSLSLSLSLSRALSLAGSLSLTHTTLSLSLSGCETCPKNTVISPTLSVYLSLFSLSLYNYIFCMCIYLYTSA